MMKQTLVKKISNGVATIYAIGADNVKTFISQPLIIEKSNGISRVSNTTGVDMINATVTIPTDGQYLITANAHYNGNANTMDAIVTGTFNGASISPSGNRLGAAESKDSDGNYLGTSSNQAYTAYGRDTKVLIAGDYPLIINIASETTIRVSAWDAMVTFQRIA